MYSTLCFTSLPVVLTIGTGVLPATIFAARCNGLCIVMGFGCRNTLCWLLALLFGDTPRLVAVLFPVKKRDRNRITAAVFSSLLLTPQLKSAQRWYQCAIHTLYPPFVPCTSQLKYRWIPSHPSILKKKGCSSKDKSSHKTAK